MQPDVSPRADVVSNIGDAIVVRPRDGAADAQRYQVLNVSNDKIREMVDRRTMREATKLARRFAAQQGQ